MTGWRDRLNGLELSNSGRWQRTEETGVLQSTGLQRVGQDLASEQQSDLDSRKAFIPFGSTQRDALI